MAECGGIEPLAIFQASSVFETEPTTGGEYAFHDRTVDGAHARSRTGNLPFTKRLLYHMSYASTTVTVIDWIGRLSWCAGS